MASLLDFLNDRLDNRRFVGWYWCALCCFGVGIAQYFLLDRRLPTVLTEIQFSGSRATGNAVLAAWNFPNAAVRVAWAAALNIVLIPLYLPLLLMSVRGASGQYLDGAKQWRGAFGAVCLLSVCAAVLENGCVIVWALIQRSSGPDGLHAAFIFASAKGLLYSATFLYVMFGWAESAWLRGAWDAVRVCGFSLFACIVGPLILLFGGQGAAIFGATASHLYPDDQKNAPDPWPFILALLATFVFSLMCWGAARYAVSYKIEGGVTGAKQGEMQRRGLSGDAEDAAVTRAVEKGWIFARDWVPRFCGCAPGAILAFIAFSVAKAARESKPESIGEQNIDVLAWGFLLVAVAVALWICLVYAWISGWWWLNVAEKTRREEAGTNAKREKIFGVGYYYFSLTLGALPFVGCFSQSPLQATRFIGPLAAWFLSFAFIVPFFTALVWLGKRGKKPLLALFLAYGYLVNAANLNDDHGLRHRYSPAVKEKWQQAIPLKQGFGPTKSARTLNNAFDAWIDSRPDAQVYKGKGKPYPVVFVAAAGGGIVAGSLVTATMGQIHKPIAEGGVPGLPDHLFAISSVSGGSLGAATYVTLRSNFPNGISGVELARREKTVFTTDMLSPSVASLLGPELVQRFLPVAVPSHLFSKGDPNYTNEYVMDRGRALDLAFERAMENGLPGASDTIRQTIADYKTPAESNLPALFLNTTCVQTGERMVVSTLRPDDVPEPDAQSSKTTVSETKRETAPLPFETLYDVDPNVDLPLSTAACLSARFPVVSPPAFLPQWRATHLSGTAPDKMELLTVKRSYVDGGYCENTGVQTVMDIVAALQAQNTVRANRPKWIPVIVSIHMNDQDVSKQTARKDDFPVGPRADAPRRGSGFDEILGPAGAFFAGWGGPPRPELMRARLRYGPNFVEMNFPKPALLSWYMSEAQYDEAERRARELLQPAVKNAQRSEPTAGDRIRALLAK